MSESQKSEHPFGGFFGVIGAIVGFGYALSISENLIAGLIVGFAGWWMVC